MKLYYTLYEDGDGCSQINQLSANPNKLKRRTCNAYCDTPEHRSIYVYDTNNPIPLEGDTNFKHILFKE